MTEEEKVQLINRLHDQYDASLLTIWDLQTKFQGRTVKRLIQLEVEKRKRIKTEAFLAGIQL